MRKIITIFLSFCLCLPIFAEENRSASGDIDYSTRKKIDYFFLEALRLRANNKHSDAYAVLRYVLTIDSTSSAVFSTLADYYFFLQHDSLAVDALQKAVKYDPRNQNYKIALADIYREIGNLSESTRLYEELVAEQPAKAELNFLLSDLYLKQNLPDKAIQSLDALENNVGMNEALSLQKHKLYLSLEQKEKALKEIEKLAAKYPFEAKYQILIGDFYLEDSDMDKALAYYEKAHIVDPQNPYYVVSMANYYEKMEDTEAATREIELALKNPSLDIDIKISILGKYIGNLLSNKKEMGSANALFKTLMEQHSQEKELNLMYGQFLASQNKWEEARFQFKVVTEAEPENLLAWRQLLNITIKEDNPDEISMVCDAAIAVFPENSEFYFYKGSVQYQKKEYPEALATFLEGANYIPEEDKFMLSTFYSQIGDLYHQLNQKAESYQAYDKALEYNENNIFALNNYAYFLSLDKTDLDKAERMCSRCIKIQPNNYTYIDTYAWIFFQRGNYSLAKFYIESAISNGGDKSPDILEHYGDIFFKTGDTEKAVQQWKKALVAKGEEGNTALLQKKINDRMYYEPE